MQRLLSAWKELYSKSPFIFSFMAVTPCMLFGNIIYQLRVLTTHSNTLQTLLKQKKLVDVGFPLESDERLDPAAFDRSAKVDDALCYMVYFMFDSLHSLILNCIHYPKREKFSEPS